MSKYLDRLEKCDFKTHLPEAVTKVPKAPSVTFGTDQGNSHPFEGFEGYPSRHVLENDRAVGRNRTAAAHHVARIAAKEAELAARGLGPDGVTPLDEYRRLAAEGAAAWLDVPPLACVAGYGCSTPDIMARTHNQNRATFRFRHSAKPI